jgi:hypothetical protein
MQFLTFEDFKTVIDLNILRDIIDYPEVTGTPSAEDAALIAEAEDMLDRSELAAMDEARGWLLGKYDIDTDFAKTGTNRQPILIMKLVDIALYNIHCILNPKVIPAIREKRYDDAITWFRNVNEGIINPKGLTKPENGSKDHIFFGSNPKRGHYI